MQYKHLQFGHGFQVVLGDEHAQAAQMTLAPGETEGGPDNCHRGADQWLFVVARDGRGRRQRRESAAVSGDAVVHRAWRRALSQEHQEGAAAHPERLRPARVHRGRRTAAASVTMS